MDRQTRIALLVDHFKKPRHKGPLETADVHMPGGNPGCGDIVTMHVCADPASDRIEEVSFEGEGCTISQAAASILAQRMNRKHPTFGEVLDLTYEEMIDLLGQDIVGSRPRCATLALGTLKAAVKRIEMDRRLRAAGRTDAEIAAMREALARQAGGSRSEAEVTDGAAGGWSGGDGLVFGEGALEKARADTSERRPDSIG
jgi:nitrogen fixation protein NifU and related proteins